MTEYLLLIGAIVLVAWMFICQKRRDRKLQSGFYQMIRSGTIVSFGYGYRGEHVFNFFGRREYCMTPYLGLIGEGWRYDLKWSRGALEAQLHGRMPPSEVTQFFRKLSFHESLNVIQPIMARIEKEQRNGNQVFVVEMRQEHIHRGCCLESGSLVPKSA
ncbi:MAG: hypothetical protein A2808_00370 [Candidatus Moranbacteria bacterium RIFCSPHIGHO2_01_FULL_55_24]|nr:MAG: hypothetical protein A2808_00370 [Candidatus Moranbacteria bacterium RIFCSPHIGHO2_01_FULL_55_24]